MPDAVKEQVTEWQGRPVGALYHIVYLNFIVAKVHQGGCVINNAVFLAPGINTEGQKALLGMWLAENDGVKFWPGLMMELKKRGHQDILMAWLKGFPDAIHSVSPQTHTRCGSFIGSATA